MDLDDIRLKDIEELSGDEKKFVADNFDKLTSEEQDYYKAVKESQSEFKLNFKTQEEFDKYVSDKASAAVEADRKARTAAKTKTKDKEEDRFFPEGFKATDWNDAFSRATPKIIDKAIREIQSMNKKQREQLASINKEFDKEFDDIVAKNPSLPAKGTSDRDAWEAEVAEIGSKYKLTTMHDAYNVWKALASAKGSVGADRAILPEEGEPYDPDASKQRMARNISRGTGVSTGAPKTKYYVGQGRRVSDILEQRKREEGIAD